MITVKIMASIVSGAESIDQNKYKSKAKKLDGSIAKHYFGFKLPN